MDRSAEVTVLLRAVSQGDRDSLDRLFSAVYDELWNQARIQRARWRGNDTLNTTSLVHEAYLKLVDQSTTQWSDRKHFFAVAARAMRHILVNYSEQRRALKRGGGQEDVPLHDVNPVAPEVADEVLELHDALERLEGLSARQARVVECRFFGGLSIEETAETLDVSTATVKRDWKIASAWLYRELHRA